jgi:3-oxoadipate enol-lactonase
MERATDPVGTIRQGNLRKTPVQKDVQKKTFTTSDNCAIAYTLRPAEKPGTPRLALIHSLALDGSIWDGVAEKLAGQAEILTYDCRGHGQSERTSGPFTTELFASDLAELLDDLGWPVAAVAGCSMGGCVAQAFAGMNPASVSALALIDTTAWYGEHASKNWSERAAAACTKGLAGLVEFQVTRWFSDRFRAAQPGLVKKMTEVFLANDVDCYAASCAMLGAADLRPALPSLHMPVTVIVGEDDHATPVAMAQQLHEAIRGSTLTILPGGRHLTPVECPDQIAAELLALLKRAASQQTAAEA